MNDFYKILAIFSTYFAAYAGKPEACRKASGSATPDRMEKLRPGAQIEQPGGLVEYFPMVIIMEEKSISIKEESAARIDRCKCRFPCRVICREPGRGKRLYRSEKGRMQRMLRFPNRCLKSTS